MTQNEMNLPMHTIEIEGQKFVVDLRTAKKIDCYRVGDRVKLLIKTYSGFEAHPGVIVGIDAFQKLPTIVVAYVPKAHGSDVNLSFAYLNASSKDTEICPMSEDDLIPTRETVLTAFERAIKVEQLKIEELISKRDYFLRQFGAVFSTSAIDMPTTEVTT